MKTDELNVVCVLKRDNGYDFNYVKILSQGVRRHLGRPHRFVCLTDADLLHRDWYRAHRIQCRPLIHGWPGSWAKIELFRPNLTRGRTLYFDLDVMMTGELDILAAYDGRLLLSSTLMAWKGGDLGFLHERFVSDPQVAMAGHDSVSSWIAATCRAEGIKPDCLDAIAPDLVCEIAQVPGGAPRRAKCPGAAMISFRHGPKPHELADLSEFVRDHWV